MLSEGQITEDAEQYRCRYQKARDLIEKLEEAAETDDATAVHTGDMPLEWR